MNGKQLVFFMLLIGSAAIAAVLGIFPVAQAQSSQAVPQAGEAWKDRVTGMEFVWIPEGEFDMGSNNGKPDEKPVHKVRLDGFWMGKYEVTRNQWKVVMGTIPADPDDIFRVKYRDDHPAIYVSWNNALEFIEKLNSLAVKSFRLPTEAEWEYACQAGTTGDLYGAMDEIAWVSSSSEITTHPVGQKKPNAWGLHDMLGNVAEWCQDWYGEDYYANSPLVNPPGPSSGKSRVCRGGNWFTPVKFVSAAARGYVLPSNERYNTIGLRLASSK